MAKRHVDEYFDIIANQYSDMLANLREIEEACQTGMLDPDRLENIKILMKPLKENYMRISYIMFLLNKPNRESKIKRYEEQNKKLLEKIGKENTLEAIEDENNEIIGQIQM